MKYHHPVMGTVKKAGKFPKMEVTTKNMKYPNMDIKTTTMQKRTPNRTEVTVERTRHNPY